MNLLCLARGQYHAYENGLDFNLPAPYTLVSPLEIEGVPHGFIAVDSNNLYLVFRGTAGWRDWLVNAEVSQVNHPLGKVHEGGYELYQELWPTIRDSLQGCKLKVVIMGYSSGCWPATFAAVDLSHYNPTVHAYGSPRVGDKEFAHNVNTVVPHYTRYVNSEDIVPTLPLPLDYCHIGTQETFTASETDAHALALYEQYCD
jgi:triacylglycerol lipase